MTQTAEVVNTAAATQDENPVRALLSTLPAGTSPRRAALELLAPVWDTVSGASDEMLAAADGEGAGTGVRSFADVLERAASDVQAAAEAVAAGSRRLEVDGHLSRADDVARVAVLTLPGCPAAARGTLERVAAAFQVGETPDLYARVLELLAEDAPASAPTSHANPARAALEKIRQRRHQPHPLDEAHAAALDVAALVWDAAGPVVPALAAERGVPAVLVERLESGRWEVADLVASMTYRPDRAVVYAAEVSELLDFAADRLRIGVAAGARTVLHGHVGRPVADALAAALDRYAGERERLQLALAVTVDKIRGAIEDAAGGLAPLARLAALCLAETTEPEEVAHGMPRELAQAVRNIERRARNVSDQVEAFVRSGGVEDGRGAAAEVVASLEVLASLAQADPEALDDSAQVAIRDAVDGFHQLRAALAERVPTVAAWHRPRPGATAEGGTA